MGRGIGLLLCCLTLAACDGALDKSTPEGSGDRSTIRVDLNIYCPDVTPGGIGEPNKQSLLLAKQWERKHPGRKIKYQPIVTTGGGEGEWLKTQLIGGKAPEIIHQNAEIAWQDTDKGWYVPLDEYLERPNPYVPGNKRWMDIFVNQALVNAKRAPDGKLYCISLDIVETGIFYNKTLLAQHGFDRPPQTWDEMTAMFAKLKSAGVMPMTSTGAGLGSDWGQDIIFEMLYHDALPKMDLLPSAAGSEGYLGHYLDPQEFGFLFTKGFFTRRDPRWREIYRLLYDWRQFWAKELKNSDPQRLFLTGRVAMLWEGSWLTRRMTTDPYINFDWGVTYVPSIMPSTSRFASGTPATVIGGAAVQLHVTNSAKLNDNLEDCIDYLMFVSAPEQIERLASEVLVFIPNVHGAKMDPRLAPFQEIFQRHYCAIKLLDSIDGEYKKFYRRMLDYYLNDGYMKDGEADADAFLAELEGNFAKWVEKHRHPGGWDFARMEKVWAGRAAELERELDPAPASAPREAKP